MENSAELIGNPITLLIERTAYLGLGLFFIVSLYRGIKRSINEKE